MKRRSFLKGIGLFALTPFVPNIVAPPLRFDGVITSVRFFNRRLTESELIPMTYTQNGELVEFVIEPMDIISTEDHQFTITRLPYG